MSISITQPDCIAIAVVQGAILLLFFCTVLRDISRVVRSTISGTKATITRGPESMNALYVVYGVTTVAVSAIAEVAEGIDGYRAAMVLINYALLTYIFFFSESFRNEMFYRVVEKSRNY